MGVKEPMKKSLIIGLFCFTIFLLTYTGGMLATVSQALPNVTVTPSKQTSFGTMQVSPCGGGDAGGGGRPGSHPWV